MSAELEAIERGLRSVSLFASLSEMQRRHIASRCRGRSAKRGKVLFREGDPGGSLVIIIKGSIAISQATSSGDKTIALRKAGDVIGEMALLDGKPRSATATVEEDADMILLDRAGFESSLKTSIGLAIELLRVMAERLREIEYGVRPLPLRTRVLQWVAKQVGDDEAPGEAQVNKSTLANQLGVRRETLSRCFSDLQREKILTLKGRSILIPNCAKLADLLDEE